MKRKSEINFGPDFLFMFNLSKGGYRDHSTDWAPAPLVIQQHGSPGNVSSNTTGKAPAPEEHMIQNEVSILRRVKHPNIVLLIEEMDMPNELYLVMELVKGGDLFDAITSTNKYTERDANGMLYNLMSAIKYLHSLNIVHRDIKPENLLTKATISDS
ncbi:unnamed protein product [Ranitomeya imitator]|uniref:Protein kinase domain-containing protein n=1 Tax=Ranitomeya imitator TaxID=111125 RepID=A0ABN9KZM5_9NEOB|nr:unnamed protein product [Ranitomeya imitator]